MEERRQTDMENDIKIVFSSIHEGFKDSSSELAEFCSEIEAELEALERKEVKVQKFDKFGSKA